MTEIEPPAGVTKVSHSTLHICLLSGRPGCACHSQSDPGALPLVHIRMQSLQQDAEIALIRWVTLGCNHISKHVPVSLQNSRRQANIVHSLQIACA